MSSIITDGIRIRNSKAFASNVGIQGNTYFFIGRPQAWVNDSNPPALTGSVKEQNSIYQSITSLKSVNSSDICPVTYRFNWTSGVKYEMYDDTLSPLSEEIPAGTQAFYVMNRNYSVFLCLYNGTSPEHPTGVLSFDEPMGQSPVPYIGPTDGYIWKYLYTLSSEQIENHLSSTYLPVISSPIDPVPGEIQVVYPLTTGQGMSSNTLNFPYYYCKVVGDGTGAVVRFSVTVGTIDKVEIVRAGSNYTFASVDITDGRIYTSLDDLDNGNNPVSIGGIKPTFRVILPPAGGYTKDLINTLSAYYLSISIKLKYGYEVAGGDSGFFSDMKFRQYGLIDNPKTKNGESLSGSNYVGCSAIKLGNGTGTYNYGETITQIVDGKTTSGIVVHWDVDNKVLFYIQTSESNLVNGELIKFHGNTTVNGTSSGASYTPDMTYTGYMSSTNITFYAGYYYSEIDSNAGSIFYVKNIPPIQRSADQVENIKLILKF